MRDEVFVFEGFAMSEPSTPLARLIEDLPRYEPKHVLVESLGGKAASPLVGIWRGSNSGVMPVVKWADIEQALREAASRPPTSPTLAQLLDEWDKEVEEHGIWTSGHSLGAKIVALLRASTPPTSLDPLQAFDELEMILYGKRGNTWEATRAEAVMTLFRKLMASTPPTDPT